jgi:hypothetical protein
MGNTDTWALDNPLRSNKELGPNSANQARKTILVVLVAKLAATIWYGSRQAPSRDLAEAQAPTQHDLPESITAKLRQSYLDRFSDAFNRKDMDDPYNLFRPAVKAQLSRKAIEGQCGKLIQLFGSIEGGAFTHAELASKQGSASIYVLYYAVRFPEGSNFGTHGTLNITLAIQGGESQIYRIHLNASQNA